MDLNEHMSYHLYLRNLMDASSAAAVTGHLTLFDRELDFYDIKDFSMIFKRGVRVGHEIEILCWMGERRYARHSSFRNHRR